MEEISTSAPTLTCDQLQTQLAYTKDSLENVRASERELKARIATLSDYLKENYEDIGEEHASAIAELFDIELTKTVEFDVNATFTIQVEVPMDFDKSDLEWSLEPSLECSSYDIEVTNADIVYVREN